MSFTWPQFDAIRPGDDVTVVFDGTTPDLVGKFQRFIGADGGTIVVTSGVDPNELTHYIDDFQYVVSGTPPPTTVNNLPTLSIGDPVTVTFNISPVVTVTGTVVGVDSNLGIVEVDDGVNSHICKDFWYITRL